MLPFFTILHPLVDACSVSVLVAGGMTWERVIAYNAIAFALQLPIGVLMDELPQFMRGGFFIGTGLTLVAAVLSAFGFGGWTILASACAGNALFHLTAGKQVLDVYDGRGGPIGLFISTGALGLMAGQVWAAKAAALCLWVFAAALAVGIVAAAWTWESPRIIHAPAQDDRGAILQKLVLVGLVVLIAWRSWAALLAGGRSADAGAFLMLVGAAVTCVGKVTGGYLAERLGRWKVTAVSVAGSVALAFLCEPSWMAAWLALLFIAQLATGAVLSLVYERVARRGGTAFGLNGLGLFAGGMV